MFNANITVEELNKMSANTLMQQLGIEFTEIGADFIKAKMPVDRRTHQPFGLLHGGASISLAETLGSVASMCLIDVGTQFCVGLEINANHLKGVRNGHVEGVVRPLHLGKSTHVWEIKINNEKEELICISRLTMAVLDKSK